MAEKTRAERVRQVFWYNRQTGELIWIIQIGSRTIPGKRAGSVHTDQDGYKSRKVFLDGRQYQASHLIWIWMTGEWPKRTIDHKNVDSLDDRWNNLREAGASQQKQNNKKRNDNRTGFKCIVYYKDPRYRDGKYYRWQVVVNGKRIKSSIRYMTAEEAHAAYCARLSEFHGEFANSGVENP